MSKLFKAMSEIAYPPGTVNPVAEHNSAMARKRVLEVSDKLSSMTAEDKASVLMIVCGRAINRAGSRPDFANELADLLESEIGYVLERGAK